MLKRVETFVVNTSAWVYPPSYQKMCERLVEERQRGPQPHEQSILSGLGEIMIMSARGIIDVEKQHVHDILDEIRPHLNADIGYLDVIDPHKATVLDRIAPLNPKQ